MTSCRPPLRCSARAVAVDVGAPRFAPRAGLKKAIILDCGKSGDEGGSLGGYVLFQYWELNGANAKMRAIHFTELYL